MVEGYDLAKWKEIASSAMVLAIFYKKDFSKSLICSEFIFAQNVGYWLNRIYKIILSSVVIAS